MRISGHIDTGGVRGASVFGTFGAGGAFILDTGGGATLGGGGSFGMDGAGIDGTRNFPAPAAAAGACSASASSASAAFGREMICVYGLGPLGASIGTGIVSAAGWRNAPVAPSPANDAGRGGAGFPTGTLGGGGKTAPAGVGATGVGATNTGSGSVPMLIGGADGKG